MNKIKVIIVDDHDIVRDGIKALLSTFDDIEVVNEFSNGDEIVRFFQEQPGFEVDVILMDVNMPYNGIDTTQKLIECNEKLKILALTMHVEEMYIKKMLKNGAMGYVLKTCSRDELYEAIKSLHQGQPYFSKEASQMLMNQFMKNQKPKTSSLVTLDDLTKREKEILKLIALEHTNQEIAEKLFISPRTVDNHRRNLLQKLGVKNTAGLTRFAINSGLLDEDK
ncbi:MAG: DNA-binding response regulator [Bacteroidetes bacterium]|nr:MAG: DNA-binding response regulator [Bacteroidota bacterium]